MRNAEWSRQRRDGTKAMTNSQWPIAKAAGDAVAVTERWLKGFRCDEADLFHASAVALEGGGRLDGAVLVRRAVLNCEDVGEWETAFSVDGCGHYVAYEDLVGVDDVMWVVARGAAPARERR